MMIYGTALLLVLLNQALAQIIAHPNSECDFQYSVRVSQTLEILNQGWPDVYKQNRICRWIVDCPRGQLCRLKCDYVALPESKDCSEDKILVSTMGSNWLVAADIYCGRTVIDTVSINYRITMGLIARANSPGGRFRCMVIPESAM